MKPVLLIALVVGIVGRDAPAAERLLDRHPYDEVILTGSNGGTVLEVTPLEIPGRPQPARLPSGNLQVELVDRLGEVYEVSWSNVARVRFYEQMLLEEARRLTTAGKYDEAYDYYARLVRDYASLPQLDDSINEYLRSNAFALYQAGELDLSLAVLESLYERNPTSTGIEQAVETVAGKVIEQRLAQQDYVAARATLNMWRTQFRTLDPQAVEVWQQRFEALAEQELSAAKGLADQDKFVEARSAADRALAIWPDYRPAYDLLAELQREHPTVIVGVMETSPREAVRRIDNWAALRSARLIQPQLAELEDFGAEGGVYRSPYGQFELDDSGLRLTLHPASTEQSAGGAGSLASDRLARYLLAMADPQRPEYREDVATSLAGVSVSADQALHLDLVRLHVRPEALLQVLVPRSTDGPDDVQDDVLLGQEYRLAAAGADGARFELLEGMQAAGGQPRAIYERYMSDDEEAIAALLSGAVDVLDRVPPWQVARLREEANVRVGTYRLPTVHVLIPNPDKPLSASTEFCRALCYGIDRRQIVQQLLLGGEPRPGFEVLSGPFPVGTSLSDPLRYAYNAQLAPRPFEPRLAAVLATAGWYSTPAAKDEHGQILAPMPELVLAHPSDPVARVACQAIQQQLGLAGIRVKLLEYQTDQLLAGDLDYDLRYAELAVWEPVVDGLHLLGPDGLAGHNSSAYLVTLLRRLGEATNWRDVRSQLMEIHEIARHDLPLIPLWQTVNYFAYRSGVDGIGRSPVTLYQNIDQWRTNPGLRNGRTAGVVR